MMQSETELLAFLDEQHIPYQRVEHPPVYTCEEAERLRPKMAAVSTKNLFLRDRHGALYLVVTACEKRLDLKGLSLQLSAPKVHFASEETLRERLGLGCGSVTVLGLINDADHRVQLWIDREIWEQDTLSVYVSDYNRCLSML